MTALAVLAFLVPATAVCLSFAIPTLIGLWPRRRIAPKVPSHAFAVLVPAHNEQLQLPAALESLAVLDYPPELVRVFVVADNCTDHTATVARWGGAVCLVRNDPAHRGKGYAIEFGLQEIQREYPDVVLVLDADCQLSAMALRELDAHFFAGADAVQCTMRSVNADDGPPGYVAAVGAAVDDARARGLDRLGFSVPLRGSGMAFRRTLLQRVPWDSYGLAEDAEFSRRLRAARVRIRHCAEAVVSCEAPPAVSELCRQRRRWRAAGLRASKPLILLHLIATVIVSMIAGFFAWPAVLILLTMALYLRAALAVGLARRRAVAMVQSPGLVMRLGLLSLAGLVRPRPAEWERADRRSDRRAA